jgi:DNA-binding PadR family transcriptional regulator
MHRSTGRRRRQGHPGAAMRGGFRGGYGHRAHRARRGDVRSAILALLTERSMHGYEMIQELEERTGGRWRPSAGSIYPTLQLLEDEGLVKAEEIEGKRVHSLTASGVEAAEQIAQRKRPWECSDEGTPHHELRSEAMRLRAALVQIGQAGDEGQVRRAVELLAKTRRDLYSMLAAE